MKMNGDEAVTMQSENEPTSSLGPERKKKRRRDRVRLQEGSRIREPGSNDPEAEPLTNETSGGKNSMTMLGISSAFDLVKKVSDKMSSKKQGKDMHLPKVGV